MRPYLRAPLLATTHSLPKEISMGEEELVAQRRLRLEYETTFVYSMKCLIYLKHIEVIIVTNVYETRFCLTL